MDTGFELQFNIEIETELEPDGFGLRETGHDVGPLEAAYVLGEGLVVPASVAGTAASAAVDARGGVGGGVVELGHGGVGGHCVSFSEGGRGGVGELVVGGYGVGVWRGRGRRRRGDVGPEGDDCQGLDEAVGGGVVEDRGLGWPRGRFWPERPLSEGVVRLRLYTRNAGGRDCSWDGEGAGRSTEGRECAGEVLVGFVAEVCVGRVLFKAT